MLDKIRAAPYWLVRVPVFLIAAALSCVVFDALTGIGYYRLLYIVAGAFFLTEIWKYWFPGFSKRLDDLSGEHHDTVQVFIEYWYICIPLLTAGLAGLSYFLPSFLGGTFLGFFLFSMTGVLLMMVHDALFAGSGSAG